MSYRIASFDGGGIRGRLSITLLKRCEIASPGLLEKTDMFAGTSTGGIIALALAFGLSPDEIAQLYADNGHAIFDASWARDIGGLDGLREAKYDNAKLAEILKGKFGDARIGDLSKTVVVPTLSLRSGTPPCQKAMIITNHAGVEDEMLRIPVWQAALMTSAAPTYFPSVGTFVDGGVVANDPAMCAVVRALRDDAKLHELRVLSFGCGSVCKPIEGEDHDWGLAQWAPKMIDLLLDGNVELAEEQCVELLGERYCRLNPSLGDKPIALDDWKGSDALVKIAMQADLGVVATWLARFYMPD